MADPTEAEEPEEQEPAPKKNWRRDLEDRLASAETRAQDAEQRAAVAEAGLTGLTPKQLRALKLSHEGDFTAEALKATAEELGFGAAKVEEQSTSEAQPTEEQNPDTKAEASKLAKLANSPAQHSPAADIIRSQEDFDAKVRSFTNEADLDKFLRDNLNLLPYGQ